MNEIKPKDKNNRLKLAVTVLEKVEENNEFFNHLLFTEIASNLVSGAVN